MKDTRLRAPSTDGALLAVPPLADAAGEIARTTISRGARRPSCVGLSTAR